MSKSSICITLAHFTNGTYTGPSLANWQGDICISTAVITSAGQRVIPGSIAATNNICFDMGGGELGVEESTNYTFAAGLTIQGDVTAGGSISTECDCCNGS